MTKLISVETGQPRSAVVIPSLFHELVASPIDAQTGGNALTGTTAMANRAMANRTAAAEHRTVICGDNRAETGAMWLHTPKFGRHHHFQRWRAAT